jgi:hypothetical protein
MIDQHVRRLIEHAVNSPTKLQLLLLFADNPRFSGTAWQVAQRIYRDIWSTREALEGLAAAGVLRESPGPDPVYRFAPDADLHEPIRRLCECYNEPLERDAIQRMVRENAGIVPSVRALGTYEFEYI